MKMYKFSVQYKQLHLPDVYVCTKICRAEYTCPEWFTEDQKKLLSRILDTNPESVNNLRTF